MDGLFSAVGSATADDLEIKTEGVDGIVKRQKTFLYPMIGVDAGGAACEKVAYRREDKVCVRPVIVHPH